ncbi:MAG: hypothetical protein LBQ66_04235 [Planctomycetaceae bacterium]|jgi:hypothetical protein|nr:hypothetical protein [Planctomycetaceae bacterium]
MISYKTFVFGFVCFLSVFVVGCGSNTNIKVSGKVSFDDGSPLTVGNVIFENEKIFYTGAIQKDGSFRMGGLKKGEGIPAGKYQVAVSRAMTIEFSGTAAPPTITELIAEKFRNTKTSGLEFDIQKKTTDIEIVVERP